MRGNEVPKRHAYALAVAGLWLLAHVAAAEEEATRSLAAQRTGTPPVIDGRLDEPTWDAAPVATGFIEHKTDRPAVEQSRVRILYDDDCLYVGFECDEPEPQRILATERKDDRFLFADDWVEVELDTFNDHLNRYTFLTNSLGTRFDGRMGPFSDFNSTWDCDWQVACTTGTDRWTAEMAIPIGELHFSRGESETWGVNFHRTEKGRQETSTWSYRPGSASPYAPQEFGHLTGLDLREARVSRRPRVETYVSATGELEGEGEVSAGADVSMRLSPQTVGTFTLNPDFGQIEADADTIELRDTERFLPEHRPFFRDGAELLTTPLDIYYSRRFVEIDAGAKVTGTGRGWTLGLLDIQGEISRGDVRREGNFLVGRYTRSFGEQNQAGLIVANSEREDGTVNRVGGADARFFFSRDTSLTLQGLVLEDQQEVVKETSDGYQYTDIEDRDARAYYGALQGGRKPFWWNVQYRGVSKDFVPDLGYIQRRDIYGPGVSMEYEQNYERGPIKNVYAAFDFDFYENAEGTTTLRDFEEFAGFTLRNELGFYVGRADEFHNPYRNRSTALTVVYNEIDEWHSASATFAHGVFEEVPYDSVELMKPLRLTDRLNTTLSGSVRREEHEGGTEDVWLWRSVTEYTFPWDGRLKFTAEDTSEERHNVTLLFSWPVRDDVDFHFVLTHARTGADEPEQRGAFTKVVYRF